MLMIAHASLNISVCLHTRNVQHSCLRGVFFKYVTKATLLVHDQRPAVCLAEVVGRTIILMTYILMTTYRSWTMTIVCISASFYDILAGYSLMRGVVEDQRLVWLILVTSDCFICASNLPAKL